MTAPVIVTFVAVGVLVAALALYLITIIALLRNIRRTAGLILFGVRAIAEQAGPVGEIVGEINADLTGVRNALQGLLRDAGANSTQQRPEVTGRPAGPPRPDTSGVGSGVGSVNDPDIPTGGA